MARKTKSKKPPVTSAQINAFIRRHAVQADDWHHLQQMIFSALGVKLTLKATELRGARLQVKTKRQGQGGTTFKPVDPTRVSPADPMAANVLTIMQRTKNVMGVEDLANKLVTSPAVIRRSLEILRRGGHNVHMESGLVELSRDIPKADPFRIDTRKLKGQTLRFGVTGDNHLASKYERLDVLEALFTRWEDEGITTVYQLGNMIDGDAHFNKFDVICRGLEAQAAYFAEHWPARKGMKTYFITGDDHEGWYVQREGVNVGRYLESAAQSGGRSDLVYLGHMEHDILLPGKKKNSVMRLIHAGGGSAYATSYSAQKIVEAYQGGEKPSVLLIGHYHKAEYGYPREVHCLQVGCTCDQTPFMRKQKIQAHVGGWIVDITVNEDGIITRFKTEWLPFYDKGFYRDAWKYGDLRHQPRPAMAAAA